MSKIILIIEDNPEHIMLLRDRLQANGFDVISATSGAEGLRKAYENKPDLILLDLIMPIMDGLQVFKYLKEGPNTSNIPIIVITAADVRNIEEKCRNIGVDACIRKPWDSNELIAQIKTLIGK